MAPDVARKDGHYRRPFPCGLQTLSGGYAVPRQNARRPTRSVPPLSAWAQQQYQAHAQASVGNYPPIGVGNFPTRPTWRPTQLGVTTLWPYENPSESCALGDLEQHVDRIPVPNRGVVRRIDERKATACVGVRLVYPVG